MQHYDISDTHRLSAELSTLQDLIIKQSQIINKDKRNNANIETLDPYQIRALLSQRTDAIQIVYLLLGLNLKVLDADMILVQGISTVKREDDLIPIALSLRYGANPNLYINSPKIGQIHVIVYLYAVLYANTDPSLVEQIATMLILSGSRIVNNAYSDTDGKIYDNEENSDIFHVNKSKYLSVLQWLKKNDYPNRLEKIESEPNIIGSDILSLLAVYLNRNDLIEGQVDLRKVIQSQSTSILSDKVAKRNIHDFIGGLKLSIDYIYLVGFETLLDHGLIPDYTIINLILIRLKHYREVNLIMPFVQLKEILLSSVKKGVEMDLYQFQMLKSIDSSYAKQIEDAYRKPMWRKICSLTSNDNIVTEGSESHPNEDRYDDFNRLVFSLNLDPRKSHKELCSTLQELAIADPVKLRNAAMNRQDARLRSTSGSIVEYIDSNNGPQTVCSNRSLLDVPPEEYNDVEVVIDRSATGSTWCYTAPMYADLIKTQKNPYTGQSLTEDVYNRIRERERILRRLKITPSNITTMSQGIEDLKIDDEINNNTTDRYIRDFGTMAMLNGMSVDDFREKQPPELESILEMVDIIIPLIQLSPDHAFATFARLIVETAKDKSDISRLIFRSYQKNKSSLRNTSATRNSPTSQPVAVPLENTKVNKYTPSKSDSRGSTPVSDIRSPQHPDYDVNEQNVLLLPKSSYQ